MAFDPEDQEIIRLLTKMKDAEGEYPKHMLVARRRHFLKRIQEFSLGIPAEIQDAGKDVKPPHVSAATSALVETALVVAIIAEASTVAYFYRDRLADVFRRAVIEPRVQEGNSPPTVETLLQVQELPPSPALTVTVPSTTTWSPPALTGIAVTPTGTPLPGVIVIPGVVDNNVINSAATGEVNVLNATPGPNDSSGNNGNNGNHYGQTPKPERTKENGNNPPPKDNEDKPPKEDKTPADGNDQPPKDKNDKPPKD